MISSLQNRAELLGRSLSDLCSADSVHCMQGDMTILGKHVDLPHVDLDMKNPLDVLKATVMPLIMNEIKAVKTELKHFL